MNRDRTISSTTLASKPNSSVPALELPFLIEKDGNQYHAYSPALKGPHVEGGSVDGAFLRAVRAAMLYLESLARHGEILSSTSGAVVPRNVLEMV
ncbi:MAG: type II toxin-antitoxin system HicB family antitoxin [Acidobacteriia bacterium]|nr:type II toxin-antitoxin system HicB family antitoxin [Terriglobia bacterium]